MTIHWNPVEDEVNPDTIDVWHVADDGTQTDIGPVDMGETTGMPDSIGGVAPDAVRTIVRNECASSMNLGNSPVMDQYAGQLILDLATQNYVRGTPP
jgi:hypothetical protein